MKKRIALLGVENSHAATFLKCINTFDEFSDIEVVGIYSDEKPAVDALVEKYGVPVLENYDSAVGAVDGIIVTARHGDNHYKYAAPYIASGIPMFIDKPITCSEEEAVRMMREMRAAGVRVSGGSSLRHDPDVISLADDARNMKDGETVFGVVRAPVQMESVYGGFFFYSQHLVEMMSEIYGKYPRAVTAVRNKNNLAVTFEYEEYNTVGLFSESGSVYSAERHTQKTSRYELIGKNGMDDWFIGVFREYVSLLRGEAQGRDYTDFIAPVFVMNAIKRSVDSGKREPVNTYSLD